MQKRIFIAIRLQPDEETVRSALHVMRQALSDEPIRWVPSVYWHITLRFLGKTDTDMIEAISRKMRGLARRHKPFNLPLHGLHVFGKPDYPKVLWWGVTEHPLLLKLYAAVQDSLQDLGFANEHRVFRPHVTLGRMKRLNNLPRFREQMEMNHELFTGQYPVKAFHLYESLLTEQGARYEILEAFELAGQEKG